MNRSLRDKMYNYEATPPAGVWNGIEAELNEAMTTNKLSAKMYGIELAPPAMAWNNIAAQLDETTLSNKLYNAEAIPPTAVWDKIESLLILNDDTRVNQKRKLYPALRYAAEAIVIGFVVFGAVRLAQPNKSEGDVVMKETVIPENYNTEASATKDEIHKLINNIIADNDEARNDAALEASKKTYARLDIPSRSIAKEVSNFYFASNNILTPGTRGLDIEDTAPQANSPTDRYITLMTPEGNIIRMSKKLGDLVCCISGETDDPQCKDQLKKWREKIVASPLGHSSESFMDILNLINSLQDNNYQ